MPVKSHDCISMYVRTSVCTYVYAYLSIGAYIDIHTHVTIITMHATIPFFLDLFASLFFVYLLTHLLFVYLFTYVLMYRNCFRPLGFEAAWFRCVPVTHLKLLHASFLPQQNCNA